MVYDVTGSGALNLDLIYEVESLECLRCEGFNLAPGREISGTPDDLARLEKSLASCGRQVSVSGGGSAANTVCVLAALGRKTAFAGYVGDDEYGERIMESMPDVGLDMVIRQGTSSVCVVVTEEKGRDRAMFVASGSCQGDFSEIRLIPEEHRCLHISSLAVENGPMLHKNLVEQLAMDTILSFDPGEIYASMGRERLGFLLDRADILFITEEELDMLAVRPDATHPDFFSDALLVKKMGARGASCVKDGRVLMQPAMDVKDIVDNTGAGDAFNAGFMDAFLDDRPLAQCLEQGVRIAALSLSGYGRHWINDLQQIEM